jgi:hypothetical protein
MSVLVDVFHSASFVQPEEDFVDIVDVLRAGSADKIRSATEESWQ